MIATLELPATMAPGRDPTWGADQIDEAIATPDPVLANLRITVVHYQLSLALRAILGPDAGANFHTWATWGSKKAGTTIRQEEAPPLRGLADLVGGGLGLLSPAARILVATTATLLGAGGLQALIQQRHDQASRQILGGNRTVLDDIGRA